MLPTRVLTRAAFATVALTVTLTTPSAAQRRAAPAAGALASDSLFLRVAGADRQMNRDELVAFLRERPAATRAGELPTFGDSIFARLDTDRSGALTRPEFAAVAQLVQFADASAAPAGRAGRGRGVAAAGNARRRAADSTIATPLADSLFKLAAGDDAKLTQQELESFIKDRPAGARVGGAGGDPARMFTRMDANRDGTIDRTEFTALARILAGGRRGGGGR